MQMEQQGTILTTMPRLWLYCVMCKSWTRELMVKCSLPVSTILTY